MIAVRKANPVFGHGDFSWVDTGNQAIAAYLRSTNKRQLLILNNLSDNPQVVDITLPDRTYTKTAELLSNEEGPDIIDGVLSAQLKNYQYLWLELSR